MSRFLGMETREKAAEVAVWAAPYLALMAAALVGLSVIVQQFWPLAFWIHGMAIGLALLYMFLFLARVRKMALDSERTRQEGGTGDEAGEES